jgi:glycine cleavage system aminomethyltransferase T
MAAEIKRQSPVSFPGKPLKTDMRAQWTVVLEYEAEGQGPYLFDLSHLARWDLQDTDLSSFQPLGIRVPETPGQCIFENGVLVNRMNRTQASIWHLGAENPAAPDDPAYTETADTTVFLGLVGQNIFAIAEKLSALDFANPAKSAPFLLQGPFSHVPCQVVTLERSAERSGILLTCSRGYARDMTHAILAAGEEFGLQPAGEKAFMRWIETLSA